MAARTEHDLNFASPSLSWDEGLPLGNGILGALVRGDGDPLRISIDRTDLWGLRTVPEFQDEEYTFATIRRWEAEVRIEDLKRVYEAPYNRAGPTKLPVGRIELRFSEEKGFRSSSLSLEEANAEVTQGGGILISIYLHAETPVGCISVSGLDSTPPRGVLPPLSHGKGKAPKGHAQGSGRVSDLGYPPPEMCSKGDWTGYEQKGWGGFRYAVCLAWRGADEGGGVWRAAWSIATTREQFDPLTLARSRAQAALSADPGQLRETHRAWWRKYWRLP